MSTQEIVAWLSRVSARCGIYPREGRLVALESPFESVDGRAGIVQTMHAFVAASAPYRVSWGAELLGSKFNLYETLHPGVRGRVPRVLAHSYEAHFKAPGER